MDSHIIGALVATFSILIFVFVAAFRYADQIDKDRHMGK